jgi:agmatinase
MTERPYVGFRTFCKVSTDIDKPYAIVGFPTDSATSFRPGARFGPSAIREASMMLTDGQHPRCEIKLEDYLFDAGDIDISGNNTQVMLAQVEGTANKLLEMGKKPVFLGGDHTITLGILRSMSKRYGPVAVLHFDAHCDTWNTHYGDPYGHGTWLYNAIEEGLVDPTKVVSIGIRSPVDPATRDYLADRGGTTISASYAQHYLHDVVDTIQNRIGNSPIYLTFDIDALDPAHAPGTGTPEIGGLSSMWAMQCMEFLGGMNWIGMDLVEVAPAYDHSGITALAGATLVWQYLNMVIWAPIEPDPCGWSDEEDTVTVDNQMDIS